MQHNVLVDFQEFAHKPTNAGAISLRIAKNSAELSIEKIAELVSKGQTLCLADVLDDQRKCEDFKVSTLLYVDLDGGMSPDECLSLCKELNLPPALMYYSFSHIEAGKPNPRDSAKPGWRYRVIWQLDKRIKNRHLYRASINWLIDKFKADGACKDSVRLVYGGKLDCVFYLDSSAYITLPKDEVLAHVNQNKYTNKSKGDREPADLSSLAQEQAEYLLNFINRFTAPMMLNVLAGSRYLSLKSAVLGSSQGLGLMQISFMSEELCEDIIYDLYAEADAWADWEHDMDDKLPPLIKLALDNITDFREPKVLDVLTDSRLDTEITRQIADIAYSSGTASGKVSTRHQANLMYKLTGDWNKATTTELAEGLISIELWNKKSRRILEQPYYDALSYVHSEHPYKCFRPHNFELITTRYVRCQINKSPNRRFAVATLNQLLQT